MGRLLSSLKSDRAILILGGVWVLVFFLVRAILEAPALANWQRVAIALAPLAPFGLFLLLLRLALRRLDELHRRVQLEALALAFPLAVVLLMTLGLVGQALDLSTERHLWHYLPVCYFIGLAVAWRRYQ